MAEKRDMPMQRPKFDWTINFGQVLQMSSIVITLLVFVVSQARFQERTEQRLAVFDAQSQKYIPVVESLASTFSLLSQRQEAQSEAIRDMRQTDISLDNRTDDLNQEMIRIRAILGEGNGNSPRK